MTTGGRGDGVATAREAITAVLFSRMAFLVLAAEPESWRDVSREGDVFSSLLMTPRTLHQILVQIDRTCGLGCGEPGQAQAPGETAGRV